MKPKSMQSIGIFLKQKMYKHLIEEENMSILLSLLGPPY